MLLTEAEAKTKWCPMIREDGERGSCGSNDPYQTSTNNCIGSNCMMWVWVLTSHSDEKDDCGECGLAQDRRG
jgi:hypothetical protein